MKRVLVKTASYKAVASLYVFGAGYASTGSAKVALSMCAGSVLYGFILYMGHEKLWESKWLKHVFAPVAA